MSKNKIIVEEIIHNARASEIYVRIGIEGNESYFIPIAGHRYDFSIDIENESSIIEYLDSLSEYLCASAIEEWYNSIESLYSAMLSERQLAFLKEMASPRGVCRFCSAVYNSSPNPQATVRELKDKGFYICTIQKYCEKADMLKTYDFLAPIPPHKLSARTENIPEKTRKQVKRIFDLKDAFSGCTDNSILPDHKFPEIRWGVNPQLSDNTNLTDDEARCKFQPLTNRFNLMKKEACKKCFAEGKRGYPYGIKFYYHGSEKWDESIPTTGSEAEAGCVGCGWYDLLKWKEELNKKINGEG